MPHIPGLRSPTEKVGRLIYLGRMLDKIRLHAAGLLPPDYVSNLGEAIPGMFDARCCRFLRVSYEEVRRRALAGESDGAIAAWAEPQSGRTEEEFEIWNTFLRKRGWRDERSAALRERVLEAGLQDKPIATFCEFIDYDEGRVPPG